jgi:hypothetical protein
MMTMATTTTSPAATIPEPSGDDSGELRLARLMRTLSISGRRLVECADGWRVVSRGDRRSPAWLTASADDVDRLRREGRIVSSPAGYVLAEERAPAPAPEAQPAAGPWVFQAAGVMVSNLGGPGFAGLAMKARRGKGSLTLRQAMAGLRLIEDAEQAGRDPMLTMNWDAVPADKQVRSGGAGGRWSNARRAATRIAKVQAALGECAFEIAYAACVLRIPLRTIERRFSLPRLGARKALAAALEKAADVYDG